MNPSIPTQNEEYWFVDEHVPTIVGTFQDPLASVTEPEEPVTAYPLQLVLLELALCCLGAMASCRVGAADVVARRERETRVSAVMVVIDRRFENNFLVFGI